MMDWANYRAPLHKDRLSDETKATAAALREALVAFMKEADRDTMPAQYITTFLLVALQPGLSVGEYAELAHVSNSVMSRHLLDIGDRNRQMNAGFGLVTGRPNPMELRKHEYFLTPKGRALFERMSRIVSMAKRR
jgi:DNA-binding MarR family transcriptional regulator